MVYHIILFVVIKTANCILMKMELEDNRIVQNYFDLTSHGNYHTHPVNTSYRTRNVTILALFLLYNQNANSFISQLQFECKSADSRIQLLCALDCKVGTFHASAYALRFYFKTNQIMYNLLVISNLTAS